jgi:hypothetical protein
MLRKDDEDFYDDYNWSYYVVFQVKVEKYRSVTDLRDLTSEQIGKIATAQAIEAAILEYNYQFNLATQTQLSYHELIYTVIVTAVSTAITIGATLCIGQVVQLAGGLASTATKELSKSASKTLMGLLQPTAGFTASSVAWAVVKEIGQEVIIDPWIESAVSGLVRRAGGDAMLQMVLSSVAESLRETLTGPFTNLFISQRSGGASFYERLDAKYFSKGLTPTVQDLLYSFNDYKAEINAQIDQQREEITALGRGFKALTFVLGAVGFGVAQFLGPPTAMLYATLATYCFTEGIPLKDVFSKVFNPIVVTSGKISESKVGDYYRNNKEETLTLIGIGICSIGLMTLQVLLPSLALLWNFGFGTITIGSIFVRNNLDKFIYITKIDKFGKLNLRYYSSQIVKEYGQRILKDLKMDLNYDSKINIGDFQITNDNIAKIKSIRRLSDFINAENKQKYQWWGYTYKFTDEKGTGYYQIGYATSIHRKGWYLRDLIFKPSRIRPKPNRIGLSDTIYSLIYNHLESVAKSSGSTFTSYYKNSLGRWNFEKIESIVDQRFKFEITGIFWGDKRVKQAEDNNILEGWRDKKALNFDRGGKGGASFNSLLPLIVEYISLGYTHRMIYRELRNTHRIYTISLSKLQVMISENFGSIENARRLFMDPLLNKLREDGISEVKINDLFNYFYRKSIPNKEFDSDRFLALLEQGFDLIDMSSYLHMSTPTILKNIDELITEDFPDLEIYIHRTIRNRFEKISPSWEDLRYYILAPIFLSYIYEGLSESEISSRFSTPKKPQGFEKHFINTVLKAVYRQTYRQLRDSAIIDILRDAIISYNPASVRSMLEFHEVALFCKDHRPIIWRLAVRYIDQDHYLYKLAKEKYGDLDKQTINEILQLVRIAIIGPILESCYRRGFSISDIISLYGYFSSESEVTAMTQLIFGKSPSQAKIFFSTRVLNPSYYRQKFGIII